MLAEIKKLKQWMFNKDIIKFIPVDTKRVNMGIVRKYLPHQSALLNAFSWSVNADYEAAPELAELKALVDRYQPVKKAIPVPLYRGVNLDTLKDEWNIFDRPKADLLKLRPGDQLQMTLSFPISFTREQNLARRFGGLLIAFDVEGTEHEFLRFTDELCVAMWMTVAALGKEPGEIQPPPHAETQREYVAMPKAPLTYTVDVLRHTTGAFNDW